jgi:N-acetylglucosaminyl-diphospho-decaprenol L-rhamnosyltransferase
MSSVTVELSFCVTNTDHRGLLRYCLDAIARERATLAVPTEVLVLDNASRDGSAEAAREHLVQPELIVLGERREYVENATTLLQRARGRFCLLLDEDAELEPGAAVALHVALRDAPRAGAAGAMLVRPDGDPLPSAWRPAWRLVRPRGDDVRRVDAVQCCAVLLRREAAEAAGWLPWAPSAHATELAFCRALARAGWEVLHVPAARAVQHEPVAPPAEGRFAGLAKRVRDLLAQ